MGEFRNLCAKEKMNQLEWPARDYIVQVARFDPAKGIPNVIDSYAKFRRLLQKDTTTEEHPQLLICGHGAVDDPDVRGIFFPPWLFLISKQASIIYDQVIQLIHSEPYREFAHDIVVMRLPPSDQCMRFLCHVIIFSCSDGLVLNALMANARIALQLSTREGFEVKVSEASEIISPHSYMDRAHPVQVHAGIPIIASLTGGIPLQVEHGKSGYLTTPGAAGNESVAKYLYDLYTDEGLHRKMSQYAKTHVSDEVGTVGNAAAWLYCELTASVMGQS